MKNKFNTYSTVYLHEQSHIIAHSQGLTNGLSGTQFTEGLNQQTPKGEVSVVSSWFLQSSC